VKKIKKVPNGWVKISEFGRLIKLNEKTILAAIKRGSIPATCADRVGTGATSPYYIDPLPAAQHWYSCLNANHPLTRPLREGLEKYIKKIDPTFSADSTDGKTNTPPVGDIKKEGFKITANTPYAEAARIEKIIKAQKEFLDLKEREKTLVQKDKVKKQLFEFGKELRDALLYIPDRITDDIIASTENRTKVRNIIYDAIAAELQRLSELNKKYE